MKLVRRTSVLVMTGVAAAAVAQPGSTSGEGAGPFDALLACRAITAEQARLACFDRTSAGLASAAERKDVVVMDRGEVRRVRRSLFGLTLPKLPFFGGGDDHAAKGRPEGPREDVDTLETTLTQVGDAPGGYLQMVVQEGGIWRTTDPWSGASPRPGAKVTIRRGALGNYFMRVGSSRTVRAERVR